MGILNCIGGRIISQTGYKEIHFRKDDFEIIKEFAEKNDMTYSGAVKQAFKKAYGLKFAERRKRGYNKKCDNMQKEIYTTEDYRKSASEFKIIIDRWIRLYKKTSFNFGAVNTEEFLKVGKCLENGSDIFDDMMLKDLPCVKEETVYIYFWKQVETIIPWYNCSKTEKQLKYRDPGKILPIALYKVIAKDLKSFSADLMNFSTDLQKYHGKTKIRVLLDSDKPMNNFYWSLETRMYNENPNNRDLSEIF